MQSKRPSRKGKVFSLKKDGGQRPVIKLNMLNEHVHTEHFKMEGIHLSVKDLLKKGDWMAKVDLKYA